jgi:Ni,Fe-hydrogenase maturation factor
MQKLGIDTARMDEDEMPFSSGEYEFHFQLQLMPEFAEELGRFDRVVFIDAHTGNVPEDVHLEIIQPIYQSSPFTHHMTASTLLSLCQVFNGKVPEAILVSVRGYEFEFTRTLSDRTRVLADEAAKRVIGWLVPELGSGG